MPMWRMRPSFFSSCNAGMVSLIIYAVCTSKTRGSVHANTELRQQRTRDSAAFVNGR